MRGGHRENAGRKSGWHNSNTQTIRVPKAFVDEILNYAHAVDNEEDYERQIILNALDRYIEEESQRDRKGNQYGKDLKPKARTWDRFNQFREWVENERRT
jgi:hypothetical protein